MPYIREEEEAVGSSFYSQHLIFKNTRIVSPHWQCSLAVQDYNNLQVSVGHRYMYLTVVSIAFMWHTVRHLLLIRTLGSLLFQLYSLPCKWGSVSVCLLFLGIHTHLKPRSYRDPVVVLPRLEGRKACIRGEFESIVGHACKTVCPCSTFPRRRMQWNLSVKDICSCCTITS